MFTYIILLNIIRIRFEKFDPKQVSTESEILGGELRVAAPKNGI
jgi:hypothetical protein